MQTQNRFLDDLARLLNGAAGVVASARGEAEAQFRQRVERWLAGFDVVPREEFEAVKAMAATARAEQEALSERVAALEARLAGRAAKARRTPRRRASAPLVKRRKRA